MAGRRRVTTGLLMAVGGAGQGLAGSGRPLPELRNDLLT